MCFENLKCNWFLPFYYWNNLRQYWLLNYTGGFRQLMMPKEASTNEGFKAAHHDKCNRDDKIRKALSDMQTLQLSVETPWGLRCQIGWGVTAQKEEESPVATQHQIMLKCLFQFLILQTDVRSTGIMTMSSAPFFSATFEYLLFYS